MRDIDDENECIAKALEGLIWPNMAIGNKVIIKEAIEALRKERERVEPVAYADPQAFRNFQAGTATKEWVWAKPDAGLVPVFVEAPPAPVVPDLERLKEIYSIFCTPTTGSDNALSAIHNACRAAMLKSGNDDIGSWSNHKNTPTDKPKSEMSRKAEQLLNQK